MSILLPPLDNTVGCITVIVEKLVSFAIVSVAQAICGLNCFEDLNGDAVNILNWEVMQYRVVLLSKQIQAVL